MPAGRQSGEPDVPDGGLGDDRGLAGAARLHFSDQELAELVLTLVVINAWNRVAITSRVPLPPA